jgi:nucleotide-binding universal stress UspA family protein
MGYKQILVSMGNPVGRTTARIAACLGAAQGAALIGRHYTFEPPAPGPGATHVPVGHPAGGMFAQPSPSAAAPVAEDNRAADEARHLFHQAAQELDLPHEFESAPGGRRQLWQCLVDQARCADLAVIGKPRGAPEERDLVKHLTAESGAPVVIVPDSASDLPRTPKLVIGWNGTGQAARAVRAALPLVEGAGQAVVFVARRDADAQASAERLMTYLERHGVAGELEFGLPGERPADGLLATAERREADLVVMGAFGRARFREVVSGGATTGRALESAVVPVLLAH